MMYINIGNNTFYVEKSKRKFKKYDVYEVLKNGKHKYILSFGDNRYQHFKDLIGEWSHLDHLDKNRRKNYRKRHEGMSGKNIYNPYKSAFWSYWYLW